jgi:hypothetical protein
MIRRTGLFLGLIIAGMAIVDSPEAGPQSAQDLGLDFSGVEAFWDLAETLRGGGQPTARQWGELLDSPGYQALTQSEFEPEFFREAFALALAPSRAGGREVLEGGRLARVVHHVRRAVELELELRAWTDELRTGGLVNAVEPACDLLPAQWWSERPAIAFVIFDFDARGYDPIVVDLLASKEMDLVPFIAHESHHWIRNRHLAFDPELARPEDEALLWVLNQLQAEGVADLIDKQRWLSGDVEPPTARARYVQDYRSNVAAAPEHIRRLDELLKEVVHGGARPDGWADSIREAIPQSGHPTGFFMVGRIVDVVGKPALVQSVGDPFIFVDLYQEAALADPEAAPPFSDQSLTVIRDLGHRMKAGQEPPVLDNLVDSENKKFLLETLARIDPPERIQELLGYAQWQHQRGGGFHGLLPDSIDGTEALPCPEDEASIHDAAVLLAQRRLENHKALAAALPTFPFHFRGDPIPVGDVQVPPGWSLVVDHSAISGFLEARSDGVITVDESRMLAGLPTNREMLRHRNNLGYVPEPLPSEEDLADLLVRAGSSDPLDRLWAWLHPWNFFAYADTAVVSDGYSSFVEELQRNGNRLAATVLSRTAAHAPEDLEFKGVFALTIGCLIRGWVTTEMPGLNVDQVKDDWSFLTRVMVHETYHKIQPLISPTISGARAVDFEDLTSADLGEPRLDELHKILAYTVLEGTANFAAGPDGNVDSLENARAGSQLLAEFVDRVMVKGDIEAAEELVIKGLQNNGPLYALGYQLSARIAAEEGPRAVGEWLTRGPAAFVLHAGEIASTTEEPLLDEKVIDAVEELQEQSG